MEEKILNTIKKLLGINSDYTVFDTDILIGINSSISVLSQLGVNDSKEFIVDKDSVWSDYLTSGENLEMIKTYIFYKTKIGFDPPQSSFVLDSIEKQINELEWRINVAVETKCI